MITDGLNPFTVLLFLAFVLAAVALIVTYVLARITRRERISEPQPVQLLRIPLPVGLDGDVQVEVHALAEQFLDAGPGPDADLLEPGPAEHVRPVLPVSTPAEGALGSEHRRR